MRTYAKLVITALAATAVLAALVSSASARNIETSSQTFRVTWTSLELSGGGATVRCQVTLEGSFHSRTIAKSVGALIGYVTAARSKNESCTGGRGWAFNGTERQGTTTLANSLPWHVQYNGFEGTLPNISALRIQLSGARFLVEILGLRCIYTTGAARGLAIGTARLSAGVATNLVASGNITRNEESPSGAFCPTGSFSSRAEDGAMTVLNSTTRITVRLI